MGVIGHELDTDRLLWIPGQKTIFLPSTSITGISWSEILRTEMDRYASRINELFERDCLFYAALKNDI
jgi:hypothetical protein